MEGFKKHTVEKITHVSKETNQDDSILDISPRYTEQRLQLIQERDEELKKEEELAFKE